VKPMSRAIRLQFAVAGSLLLATCSNSQGQVPPCPYHGVPDTAPSAGCLILAHDKVLLVESARGGVSPPGGKTKAGESAQCAAHRETFEETGLDLIPRELIGVFDTGFHLYRCEIHAQTGQVKLGAWQEVRGWRWLPVEDFEKVRWRYPGQGRIMRSLLVDSMEEKGDGGYRQD